PLALLCHLTSSRVRLFFSFVAPRALPSFPTRRSSDLSVARPRRPRTARRPSYARGDRRPGGGREAARVARGRTGRVHRIGRVGRDRKSTRLNSSHGSISYAVFCLKKKKKNEQDRDTDA